MRPEERVRRGHLIWWDGRVSLLVLDLAVFTAVCYLELHSAVVQDKLSSPLYLAALVAFILTFAPLRRRFPVLVLVVALAGIPAGLTLGPATVAVYTVAVRHGLGWITGGCMVLTLIVEFGLRWRYRLDELPAVALSAALFVFAPVLAGLWMNQRAALLAVLRGRAEEAERTRTLLAEQAVSAERRRIAREMHDVVAHRVTAIALQAGALSVTAPDEHTGRTAETIRSVSVTALDELRGILRVLRDEAEEGEPPPSRPTGAGLLGSVEQLVAGALATGARVELQLPDPLPMVPEQVERAVYRVVQEALTNAGKHAPHAAIQVGITATKDSLIVEVCNRLSPRPANVPGSGYGLLGMRERVELAGGRLTAGHADGGVFRVTARFPLEEKTS
ncbi:sensor histidine kinase [Crossiella sp. NPDC003009]